jgi:hypothetical protein
MHPREICGAVSLTAGSSPSARAVLPLRVGNFRSYSAIFKARTSETKGES